MQTESDPNSTTLDSVNGAVSWLTAPRILIVRMYVFQRL
jgi:hypothetical protein